MKAKLSLITLLVASSLVLGGCASTKDYQAYSQGQAAIEQAKYAADAARFKAMSDIAASGDASAKVAAVVALAMSTTGGQGGGQSAQLKAPEAPGSSMLAWASVLVPALSQGYQVYSNTKLGMAQSNNSVRVTESTNNTFLGIASKIQAPVAPQANVTTLNVDSHDSSLSGGGVLGSGTYSPSTTTSTLSGTGNLGSGSYSTQSNPTILSGTGVLGNGTYTGPVTTPTPVVVTPVVTTPPVVVTPVTVTPVVVTNP